MRKLLGSILTQTISKRNKRFLRLFALAILLLSLTFILTGCGCKHKYAYIIGDWEASCYDEGYTGDIYCEDCGSIIKRGESIPRLNHIPEEIGYCEPSCETDGYTGDTICQLCYDYLEYGNFIPAKGHVLSDVGNAVAPSCTSEGYTGDLICDVCSDIVCGSAIPRETHNFANHICTECTWPEPGLYLEGEYAMTWENLTDMGYVHVSGGTLERIDANIYGTLVVGEDITALRPNICADSSSCKLREIYLPCTINEIHSDAFLFCNCEKIVIFGKNVSIGEDAFRGCTSLKTVEAPNGISYIGSNAFQGCSSLTQVNGCLAPEDGKYGTRVFLYCESLAEFSIPNGITKISSGMFEGCSSLAYIDIPESVNWIGSEAFKGCVSLKNLNLPESDEPLTIGRYAFQNTGIETLVLASNVEMPYDEFAPFPETYGAFSDCKALRYVDLSHTKITAIPIATFENCSNLKEIKLPPMLEKIEYKAFTGTSIEKLVLPESTVEIGSIFEGEYWFEVTYLPLESIVWPRKLIHADAFYECPNLNEIYYSGSEIEWSLAGHDEYLSNANVTFNYENQ